MDTKVSKKELAMMIREYTDLIFSDCLCSRNDKVGIPYISVGHFLESMREELKKHKKGEITLKGVDVYSNKDSEIHRHIFTIDIRGKRKALIVQTTLLTENQSHILCERISAEFMAA